MLNGYKFKYTFLFGSLSGAIIITYLYLLNLLAIRETFVSYDILSNIMVIGILALRIILLMGMSLFMFRKWLKAENQFFDDIPFLLAMFFFILVFGKFLDFLIDYIYHTSTPDAFELIYKIRYIVAIINLFPMYMLSLSIILHFLSMQEKFPILSDEKTQNQIKKFILGLIIMTELAIIFIFLDVNSSRYILPVIVIPSFVIIATVFIFTYKNKMLSQVHSLIMALSLILYLLSQIIRPLVQSILGFTPAYILITEFIDLVIFILIFISLLIKPKYVM